MQLPMAAAAATPAGAAASASEDRKPDVGASAPARAAGTIPEGPLDAGGDEIATLEEAIDFLLRIMAASISYLTRKAPHVQTSTEVPLAALSAGASQALVEEETMVASADELVGDLMLKAKQVEAFIQKLPDWATTDVHQPAQLAELEALQEQMCTANEEYRAAVHEAKDLQAQVGDLLRQACEDAQRTKVAFAKANGALPG